MEHLGDILVLGLGTSGAAAARYCAKLLGSEASSLTVVDGADGPRLRELADELAGEGAVVMLGASALHGRYDLCIASPGIPPHSELMRAATQCSARVISELEFAYSRSDCPWVAVTGTNGKTTTTALLAHLLDSGGIPALAVGNIGVPAIEAVAECDSARVLVAEVSSFQLALTETFHPRAAVLLNITPDHIDWHGSLESYVADKTKIFSNLTADDVAVIDIDDEGSAPYAEKVEARGVPVVRVSLTSAHANGAYLVSGTLALGTRGGTVRLVPADELRVKGPHNVSNALAAAAAAHALGVGAADLKWGLTTFEPIEHRLEPVGTVCGADWFNDSKATNPDAVSKALASFEDRPLVLLLGGRNKGNDFAALAKEASERCSGVVLFGESAPQLLAAFRGSPATVRQAGTLADAVLVACELAEPGAAVVLSPACASFDEFENYGERGRAFKALVAALGEGGAQ